MAYEKPEIITLSLAAPAVRAIADNPFFINDEGDGKQSHVAETGSDTDYPISTSSSSAAYQADE